jgi:hypothetical protein
MCPMLLPTEHPFLQVVPSSESVAPTTHLSLLRVVPAQPLVLSRIILERWWSALGSVTVLVRV